MKINDIIALAKQGYKPADIKELISLAEPENKEDDEPEDDPLEESNDTRDTPPAQEDENKDEVDYKKLYEETEKKLKAAQAANRRDAEHNDIKTPEQIALEHFNSILK